MPESLQAYGDQMAKVIDALTADVKQNASSIQTTNKDRTTDIRELNNKIMFINAAVNAAPALNARSPTNS